MMDNVYSPKAEDNCKHNDPRSTIYIKKNYIDPAQGFLYSLGCSLVHFALFITIFTVEPPDHEAAKKFDDEYLKSITG